MDIMLHFQYKGVSLLSISITLIDSFDIEIACLSKAR